MITQLSSLQKGLVLHADLDQESYNPATKRVTDKSAYNNHGTSVNAASFVSDRMGQADRAMSFNGSSDYIDCGNDESLTVKDLTVSMWAKTVAGNLHHTFASKYHFEWEIRLRDGNIIGFLKSDGVGGTEIFTSDIEWIHGQWSNIVCTFDHSTKDWKTYIDDDNVWTQPCGSSSLSNPINNNVSIGIRPTHGNYLVGLIANLRIYNRVLTSAERTLLYESYRPRLVI